MLLSTYYMFKRIVPRSLQILLRRQYIRRKQKSCNHIWPIDYNAGRHPAWWSGWPAGRQFALVLTHDIETAAGLPKCRQLAALEESLGFRSSFNFVAGDYPIPPELRFHLADHGFEIGVHGLHHNNNLFHSESFFLKQAKEINRYLKEWDSVGFRSPSMFHNLDLLHCLDIEYDSSTFDTDPFEPQPDGMGTIFPFHVSNEIHDRTYIELPYTLSQDFLLFVILQEKTLNIWKEKLDYVVENGGMALFVAHPDYMKFDRLPHLGGYYPSTYYEEFLNYIKYRYKDKYWNALPRDMARFWSSARKGCGIV